MPAAYQKAGASPRQERVARAVELLREALQIIDSIGEFPDLGATLNEVIEGLEEQSDGQ